MTKQVSNPPLRKKTKAVLNLYKKMRKNLAIEKKPRLLAFFLSEFAQIKLRSESIYKQKFQRKISKAIKQARASKLLPYLNQIV